MKKIIEKIKAFSKKIFSLSLKLKIRITASFLCALFLVASIGIYLNTYSEPIIPFLNDPDYIASGVSGSTVYVNDLLADWYYYIGKNYTDSNGTLPTTVSKNHYGESNLAKVKITYSGTSLNGFTGTVSTSENQNEYIYFKTYPINDNGTTSNYTDDYIMIELIDNPFSNRPNNTGFNGWITTYASAVTSYDDTYYVRYAKVPITYTTTNNNRIPDAIDITFNASWTGATVYNMTNSWTNAFDNMKTKGMSQLIFEENIYGTLNMAGYFHSVRINRNRSCSGYYNNQGVYQNNCTCNTWGGCTYYQLIQNEIFNENSTYYELQNGYMTQIDNNTVVFPVIGTRPIAGLTTDMAMAGYFKQTTIANGSSYTGYYNNVGVMQNGNCSNYDGCTVYELIQYYDSSNNVNVYDANTTYYYLVTRDTNIIVMTANISSTWSSNKPFTVTGSYNGTNYNPRWTVTNLTVFCYNDTRIENMIIYDNASLVSDYAVSNTNTDTGVFFANFKNLKIGRGITKYNNYQNFEAVVGSAGSDNSYWGGSTASIGSNGNPTKYRIIIESGLYNGLAVVNGAASSNMGNFYVNAQAIYGNDYDRVTVNNSNLTIHYTAAGSWGGTIYASTNSVTSTEVAIHTTIKSGTFGASKYDYAAGVYVGGLHYGTHNAIRQAKIEGGYIYNLIGGPLVPSNRENVNDIMMEMTGGTVDMIIGGAGRSETFGNRIISVTGGTVSYSVFGGSNSYQGSSTEGTLTGSTYIYIGGTAIIGNQTYVNNNNTQYGAEAGSVFGIGNGKSGTSTIGSANNSNIVIADNATVRRNVYGGGNYGATGVSSNLSTTYSNIIIEDGIIYGNVYGGGNNNGAGDASTLATINITMNGGNVIQSIYGGSNQLGTIFGNVNIKVNGGEVGNSVYGGGQGGWSSNTASGTFVARNVDVVIGDPNKTTGPIINQSVYGGSAFGTVNSTTRSTTVSSYTTKVTVNKGEIGNVFGGGQGNTTYTPYVAGNVTVTINQNQNSTTTIDNVYGGNDAAGIPNGSLTVYLNGGTIGDTFGGGRATGANTTNVYLQGATSARIFGGSDTSGNVTTTNVTCTSGTSETIFGGNNLGGSTATTNVTVNGGNITTVYGGGQRTNVTTKTNVTLTSTVSDLFGGSNELGDVTLSDIIISNGVANNIYGGNNDGGTTSTSRITINGCGADKIYGGGRNAATTTSNIDFNYGMTNYLFGGGSQAGVTTTNVKIGRGTIRNLYGGSDMSGDVTTVNVSSVTNPVTKANINVATNVSVSNINQTNTVDHASSENLNVTITNNSGSTLTKWKLFLLTDRAVLDSNWSDATVAYANGMFYINEIDQWYGTNPINNGGTYNFNFNIHSYVPYADFKILGWIIKGYNSSNNVYVSYSNNMVDIDSLYGGNNAGGVTTNANVNLTSGDIDNVYGGGKNAVTGTTDLDLTGVIVNNSVYGGGDAAAVTNVTANISNSTIGSTTSSGNIYGGGNQAGVNANVNLTVDTATHVYGNVYGGGNQGNVIGNVDANINNITVSQNIYGGGNQAAVNGNITLDVLNNTVVSDSVYGGGNNGATLGTATTIITSGTVSNGIYGGGNSANVGSFNNTATAASLTITSTNTCDVYGGGRSAGVNGSTSVTVTSSNITCNAYGGGNGITSVVQGDTTGELNPAKVTGNANITINGSSTVTNNVFGGGNLGFVMNNTSVTIDTSTIGVSVYGGGNNGDVIGGATTNITGSSVATNVFGGGNNGDVGDDVSATISNTTGIDNIFGGGNNAPVTGDITLIVNNNTTVSDSVYGGGNEGAVTGNIDTTLTSVSVDNTVFGGGNNGTVTGNVTTTISTITAVDNIYGGGNNAPVNGNAILEINTTSVISNSVYGGGNYGAVTGSTDTTIANSSVATNIFGGGNNADVTLNATTSISTVTEVDNIYGGGNAADVEGNVILDINSDTVVSDNVYGGGNYGIVGGSATSTITSSTVDSNIYGGGNNGNVTGNVNATITTVTGIDNIYGGGNNASVGGNIILGINTNTVVSDSIYGGGNNGTTLGTVTSTIANTTATNGIYGGGNNASVGNFNNTNTASTLTATNVTTCDIYGGGRAAGVNGSTTVTITGSTITCNAFGGGNGITSIVVNDVTGELNPAKVTGNTTITINGNTTVGESVYGGGNLGFVNQNANVNIASSTITENAFGGGNAARVKGNCNVLLTSATIGESAYAGGNGVMAIVEGSTNLNIEGATNITHHVFGGGNAAATGLQNTNNSVGVVNIAGAVIGGNVYGGANTSVLYGATTLNIGQNAIPNNTLTPGNIQITGTVFGGGEANASGSETYDYNFISVTLGITIHIDGLNHTAFSIGGSIFGSGNASSTTGYSSIDISNYGTTNNIKNNISIQRANLVTIKNSHIKLAGATDRTNEYSAVLFSLSRIDELKLKNNSTIYLKTGANLLQKLSSVVDINNVEIKAAVTIDDTTKTVTKNVDNRLYMFEGKILNVATNESVTSYGEVYGMTFFGMYREDGGTGAITALYSSAYDYGDTAPAGDVYYFTDGSYVLGRHNTNHDIEADGFYSNKTVEENPTEIITFYIEPTPEDSNFYMWVVGSKVETYDITLTASKYATLGVHELSLLKYYAPNTSFSILGFNYSGLAAGASLKMGSTVPRIAPSTTVADNVMGLAIKQGQSGWITIGQTNFISSPTNPVTGTTYYEKENSTVVPSFLFYLYHSKNMATSGSLGTVTISLIAITPIDDLTNVTERININVEITRALYNTNDYEATMTVGKQYEMFAPSVVNITSKSSLSAYYSLYMESSTNPYRTGDYRVLVSSYAYPVDTKITMIDYVDENNPIYYYYVVNQADYDASLIQFAQNNEVAYQLSKFIKMGSTSSGNNYSDSVSNNLYYDSGLEIAQEEFIFIVDFKESNINANVLSNDLLMELRSGNGRTLITVLGVSQANMVYNLYHDSDAVIDLAGTISTINFYNGNNFNMTVNTNFIQQTVLSNTIYDTSYHDQKLGIKISIYDEYNNRLTSSSLMGIYFENNGINYYPRDNGEVRINIAERVANVSSRITVHAENSNLAGGEYRLVMESFGSPDGIYYGLTSSDSLTLNLRVMDTLYGLSISIPENNIFINKDTGLTLNNSNYILATVTYASGLEHPNIRVKLYRRDYDLVYSTAYTAVDFRDYFTNDLLATPNALEYYFNQNPIANLNHFLYLKDDLMTGTYKLELRLYDQNTFIGEVYRYIIIK